jgi:hypothetical protein
LICGNQYIQKRNNKNQQRMSYVILCLIQRSLHDTAGGPGMCSMYSAE